MSLARVAYLTIMVTPSGALSPGPLTFATIAIGTRFGWRGGVLVALGHMMVKLPYIALLYLCMSCVQNALKGFLGNVLTVAGAAIILYFAVSTMITLRRSYGAAASMEYSAKWFYGIHNPVVVGVLFTGLNVWFLIWWLSIGFELISMVTTMGIHALAVMYVSHVWIDFVWLAIVAEAGRRGAEILGKRDYCILMLLLSILLALFGINMLLKRFIGISILP